MNMHHNFLFDLDQTLLSFHTSEYQDLNFPVIWKLNLGMGEEQYKLSK